MLASPPRVTRDLPRFFRSACSGLLGLVLIGHGPLARATPSGLYGVGPRSTALVGGGTSLPLGAASTLVNPAALAETRNKELSFGLCASEFSLAYDTTSGTQPFDAELAKSVMIGVAAPLLPPDPHGFRAALGLFAQTPPDYLVRAHAPFPEDPSFPLLVDRASALDLGVGLGLGFHQFSLGVGVEVLAALRGKQSVGTSAVPSGVGTELFPAWAPVLGLGVDLGQFGQLGVSFRSVLRADFDVEVPAPKLADLVEIAPLNVSGVAHYEPLKLDAELSRAFGPVRLILGGRYEHWSDFPGWVGPTVECPAGVTCGTAEPPKPDYTSVFVPRLGVEGTLDARPVEVALRAGYSFVPTPIPEQTGVANAFDSSRHALAAGYRVGFPRRILPLSFEGAVRLDLLADRTHDKVGTAAAGPLGPSVTTHGHALTWVFGLGVEL
jgi:long-chain fatty acid transport protein